MQGLVNTPALIEEQKYKQVYYSLCNATKDLRKSATHEFHFFLTKKRLYPNSCLLNQLQIFNETIL